MSKITNVVAEQYLEAMTGSVQAQKIYNITFAYIFNTNLVSIIFTPFYTSCVRTDERTMSHPNTALLPTTVSPN